MSPEALLGTRLKGRHAMVLDVYAFAIVLWEIWTRARPWDEIQEEGIQFSAKLTEVVNDGQRPQLPDGCEPAPDGYQALMGRCWAGRPEDRPTFATVLGVVAAITPSETWL